MKKSIFFSDQNVLPSDINAITAAYSSEIINTRQTLLDSSGGANLEGGDSYPIVGGGVVGNVADHGQNKNLRVVITTSTATVYPGYVIDVNGEIVYADNGAGGALTLNRGQGNANYIWVDNLSGKHYVKIKKLAAQSNQRADDLGVAYYTREENSFFISVDTDVPVSGEVLLATFNATSGTPDLGSFVDARLYLRVNTTADAVGLDPYTIPYAGILTVEDHILSLGTGIPSSTNPHGLTPEDIGMIIIDKGEEHRAWEHLNGIMATRYTTTSKDAYKVTISGINVIFSQAEYAYMIIDGTKVTGDITFTTWASAYTAHGDGSYYVAVNKNKEVFFIQSSSYNGVPFRDPGVRDEYLYLAIITIAGGGSSAVVYQDIRKFYTVSPYEIRFDPAEGTSNPSTLTTPAYSLVDNLNRIRYQLSKALVGDASNWGATTPVMFSGANVDGTHLHSFSALDDAVVNGITIDDLIALTNGADAAGRHYHSNTEALLYVIGQDNPDVDNPTGVLFHKGGSVYGGLVRYISDDGDMLHYYDVVNNTTIVLADGTTVDRGTRGTFRLDTLIADTAVKIYKSNETLAEISGDELDLLTNNNDASTVHHHDSLYGTNIVALRMSGDVVIPVDTDLPVAWGSAIWNAAPTDFFDVNDSRNSGVSGGAGSGNIFKVPVTGLYRLTGFFNVLDDITSMQVRVSLFRLKSDNSEEKLQEDMYLWSRPTDAIHKFDTHARINFHWIGELYDPTYSGLNARYLIRITHYNAVEPVYLKVNEGSPAHSYTQLVIEKIPGY